MTFDVTKKVYLKKSSILKFFTVFMYLYLLMFLSFYWKMITFNLHNEKLTIISIYNF